MGDADKDLIFSYTWDDICRAQQGGSLSNKTIDTTRPERAESASEQDLALLASHGLQGLISMEYHGVIDRLRRARLIEED